MGDTVQRFRISWAMPKTVKDLMSLLEELEEET